MAEPELYYSYKVQKGDTLELIIQQFTKKELPHMEHYMIDAELSVQDVWNDEANKSPGYICHKGFSKREGKNAQQRRVYPGEWVALPYNGFLYTPPEGNQRCKTENTNTSPALWVHGKQEVKIVPIMFLPGIMGTRLRKCKTEEKEKIIWDPDKKTYMIKLSRKKISKKQELLGISNTPDAEPITDPVDSKRYTVEQRARNYAAVASDFYEVFLKTLETKLNSQEISQDAQDTEIIYPVYVCPYDWRKDITNIAKKEVKDVYDIIKKEQGSEEIIIITHSMGGLVAREFLRQNSQMAQKIKGVIHGVQPVAGAVQFYAYFKCGTQKLLGISPTDLVLKGILGRKKRDFAALCCDIPGAIELAPVSNGDKQQWLSWDAQLEQEYGMQVQKDDMFGCYEELDGILGLTAPDSDDEVNELILRNIAKAKTFHEKLGTFRHDRTYTLSSSQVKTVQSVHIARNNITVEFATDFCCSVPEAVQKAKNLTREQKSLLYGIKAGIPQDIADMSQKENQDEKKAVVRQLVKEHLEDVYKTSWDFQDPRVQIIITKDKKGDGTVPLKSQQALEAASEKKYAGIEHGEFYKNDTVINDVITLIKESSAQKAE